MTGARPGGYGSLDEEALTRWGRRVGSEVEAPVTFALEGPLGAGKSVLARAIARGAGVVGDVPSPTYTLVHRHEGAYGRSVVHIDLYRIRDAGELVELGWEELGGDGEITIVEWPERAGEAIPDDRWVIRLDLAAGAPELRDVHLGRFGDPPDIPAP